MKKITLQIARQIASVAWRSGQGLDPRLIDCAVRDSADYDLREAGYEGVNLGRLSPRAGVTTARAYARQIYDLINGG